MFLKIHFCTNSFSMNREVRTHKYNRVQRVATVNTTTRKRNKRTLLRLSGLESLKRRHLVLVTPLKLKIIINIYICDAV